MIIVTVVFVVVYRLRDFIIPKTAFAPLERPLAVQALSPVWHAYSRNFGRKFALCGSTFHWLSGRKGDRHWVVAARTRADHAATM